MSSPEQNPPTVGGQEDEAANTSRDTPAPPLPQRPANLQQQPLPQPFHSQQHQHPYVPYPGLPNQPLTYATPVRPLPKQAQAYIATRLGLTALSSVWGIIIIALTSILLSEGGEVASVSLYAYAIVVVSILWNTAELITYCVRLRKETQRGIHPGAHVGVNLILWLIGIFAILLTVAVYQNAAYSVERCSRRGDDDDEYSYRYYGYSYCSDYEPLDYYRWNILPVLRALIAIFALWTINHFVLFVLACIDTHKRNVLKPAAFVVPVSAPTAAIPVQGMYFPQQAGAQPAQPMQYYPYPIMMQPQPVQLAPAGSQQAAASSEKQPAQPGQNLAGFYAPASGPSTQAP